MWRRSIRVRQATDHYRRAMPDERPTLALIDGEGQSNIPAESSRKRIDAAFAPMAEFDVTQWDDLIYGPGGGPPPAPESEPVIVADRPPSFRLTP